MMRLVLGFACLASAVAAETQPLLMPSGMLVHYHDEVLERQPNGETWLTLRYIAPMIGSEAGKLDYNHVAGDIDRLCESEGIKAAARAGGADQVIITLIDHAVERGTYDPETTMFIGAYLLTEGGCVWE